MTWQVAASGPNEELEGLELEEGTTMQKLFKWVYLAGMIIQIIVRVPYDRQRRKISKKDQRVSRTERILFGGLSVGVLLLPLVYTLTRWLNFADFRLSRRARARAGIMGTLSIGAGLWLFARAHHDLGTNWSPSLEMGDEQTLVTRGVYRTIRHPMYTAQLLFGIAQALLLPNWIAGSGGLLTFAALYKVRIPPEERMMLDHFGDDYQAYSERTGRILPRLP